MAFTYTVPVCFCVVVTWDNGWAVNSNGDRYMFDSTPRTKEDAMNACWNQDYWASLLMVVSTEEAEFLKTAANQLVTGGVVTNTFSYYMGETSMSEIASLLSSH